jgi:hypothetical protein
VLVKVGLTSNEMSELGHSILDDSLVCKVNTCKYQKEKAHQNRERERKCCLSLSRERVALSLSLERGEP